MYFRNRGFFPSKFSYACGTLFDIIKAIIFQLLLIYV